MAPRLELHERLKALLGSSHVYFQPPESVKLSYPAIVYRRDYANTTFADNNPHVITKRYQVTVVDPDPDSDIPGKVAALPMCVFDRHYTKDDLNHDVYKLFF